MPTRFLEHLKTGFDVILIIFLYIGGVFALSNETIHIITIIGASLAGALVLAYFRRERNTKEIFFKSACASICGLVVGAILTRRYDITSVENEIGVYFFSSLLSFFLIKGLLNVTEKNASDLIVTIFQKILPQNTTNRIFENQNLNGQDLNGQIIKTDVIVKQDGEIKEIKQENL